MLRKANQKDYTKKLLRESKSLQRSSCLRFTIHLDLVPAINHSSLLLSSCLKVHLATCIPIEVRNTPMPIFLYYDIFLQLLAVKIKLYCLLVNKKISKSVDKSTKLICTQDWFNLFSEIVQGHYSMTWDNSRDIRDPEIPGL